MHFEFEVIAKFLQCYILKGVGHNYYGYHIDFFPFFFFLVKA